MCNPYHAKECEGGATTSKLQISCQKFMGGGAYACRPSTYFDEDVARREVCERAALAVAAQGGGRRVIQEGPRGSKRRIQGIGSMIQGTGSMIQGTGHARRGKTRKGGGGGGESKG